MCSLNTLHWELLSNTELKIYAILNYIFSNFDVTSYCSYSVYSPLYKNTVEDHKKLTTTNLYQTSIKFISMGRTAVISDTVLW